jgi:hypothetical protein
MHGEMPGFFPGRPGGEHDEPLLDMILERRPVPPGAPPEIHGLAHMLAAVAGPAEPGELTGEAATLAAFTRLGFPVGVSPAAPRSARRSVPEWRARGRLPLAAALTAVAVGLGGTAAAYAGVLPDPIQHFAHEIIGAPAPHHDLSGQAPAVASSPTHTRRGPAGSAPASHQATSSAPHPGDGSRDRHHGFAGSGPGNNLASCQPSAAQNQNQDQDQNTNHNQSTPTPTPAPVTQSPDQGQGQAQGQSRSQAESQSEDQAQSQSKASPSPKSPASPSTVWASAPPTATACPTASRPG